MTVIKIESDFWRKKIEGYIQEIERTENKSTPIPKPTNWNLIKRLSDEIRISISCNSKDCKTYSFTFTGANNFKYFYSDSAEKIIRLFNLVYQSFEKDNAELQSMLIPIKERENSKMLEQEKIRVFAENLMKDSDYEWKLKDNTLQIKLKCNRIFELSLNTKAIVKFKKEYIKMNFTKVLNEIDSQFTRIPFLVNINNSIRNWS